MSAGPAYFRFRIPQECDKTWLKFVIAKETSLSMTSTNAQRVRALDLLKSRGMLRLKDFMAEGIGPETLARLVREAAVVRSARGLYQLPDTQIEAAHMLAEAAVLVPKGVVCLTSALQYHELTLQMPSAVWMAIERTAWRPKIDYPRIRFVRFAGSALTKGSSAIASRPSRSPSRIRPGPSSTVSATGPRWASTLLWRAFVKASAAGGVRPTICGVTRERRGSGQ